MQNGWFFYGSNRLLGLKGLTSQVTVLQENHNNFLMVLSSVYFPGLKWKSELYVENLTMGLVLNSTGLEMDCQAQAKN